MLLLPAAISCHNYYLFYVLFLNGIIYALKTIIVTITIIIIIIIFSSIIMLVMIIVTIIAIAIEQIHASTNDIQHPEHFLNQYSANTLILCIIICFIIYVMYYHTFPLNNKTNRSPPTMTSSILLM